MLPLAMSANRAHPVGDARIIVGFVVVLAVAALLSLLISLVKIIDRRVVEVRDTLKAAAANTADTALIPQVAERRGRGPGRRPPAPPVPRPGAREGEDMTTLVILTVLDIVLLIAGLAFYLFWVGTLLTRIAGNLEECARDRAHDRRPRRARSRRAWSTSTRPAASSPARCRCCTGWPRASSPASRPRPGQPPAAARAGPARVGDAVARACTTPSGSAPTPVANPHPRVAGPDGRGRPATQSGHAGGQRTGLARGTSPIHSSFHDWSYCWVLQRGLVDRRQLAGDLLPVRPAAARHP